MIFVASHKLLEHSGTNASTEWIALMFRIRKVWGLNRCLETSCTEFLCCSNLCPVTSFTECLRSLNLYQEKNGSEFLWVKCVFGDQLYCVSLLFKFVSSDQFY
jgi:hypothetical protein